MKKISVPIKVIILILLLISVAFLQYLYRKDSKSLEQVRLVHENLQAYCALKKQYPDQDSFQEILITSKVNNRKEWILYTSDSLKEGSLQYPMNLPILWAPGEAKLSPFIPMIYAFIIRNPCTF